MKKSTAISILCTLLLPPLSSLVEMIKFNCCVILLMKLGGRCFAGSAQQYWIYQDHVVLMEMSNVLKPLVQSMELPQWSRRVLVRICLPVTISANVMLFVNNCNFLLASFTSCHNKIFGTILNYFYSILLSNAF